MFAGMCGAVLHGKVARVRSQAQVLFTDPIVVRYGEGVIHPDDDDDDDDDEPSQASMKEGEATEAGVEKLKQLPCPLLEFRVVNRLHAAKGGEIMDATMNIVASIDEQQISDDILNENRKRTQRTRRRGKKLLRGLSNRKLVFDNRSSDNFPGGTPTTILETRALKRGRNLSGSTGSLTGLWTEKDRPAKSLACTEDFDGNLIAKRVFVKLNIESPEHPFFKRVWLARHILDQDSPLLTKQTRKAIKQNGNHWPPELNNYESVKASIRFENILVSLSGTCNVDAYSVYAQKVYKYDDIIVGYRFVNMLYQRHSDLSLNVDISVLDDVCQQKGGGGEPFKQVTQDNAIFL